MANRCSVTQSYIGNVSACWVHNWVGVVLGEEEDVAVLKPKLGLEQVMHALHRAHSTPQEEASRKAKTASL